MPVAARPAGRHHPAGLSGRGRDRHVGHLVTVTGTGLLARCLQHETGHLRGTLYLDLLPPAERAAILVAAGLPGSGRASL
jgi:peptide deformylase